MSDLNIAFSDILSIAAIIMAGIALYLEYHTTRGKSKQEMETVLTYIINANSQNWTRHDCRVIRQGEEEVWYADYVQGINLAPLVPEDMKKDYQKWLFLRNKMDITEGERNEFNQIQKRLKEEAQQRLKIDLK